MKNRVLIELEERLKRSRFHHTLRVTDTAMELAKDCDEDVTKAEIAGLFHDLAKNLNDEELLAYIELHDLEIDDIVKRNLYLAHGMVAADIAMREYGVDDEDILEAIWYHTIGRASLSKLAKIIYVADYIEPNRVMNGVEAIRQVAESGNLDKALLMTVENQITYLLTGHQEIHPNALEMRNELIRNGVK
ncbi:MAG: bis(5'-nucleosyl)-tetraphosphatase (symmetrical) YqeK [Clostridia bacterium]|nr:bis(5'-nucleosyl)-tetraphosphatase (symmetrical) YqeK [Clostridia bacterium]